MGKVAGQFRRSTGQGLAGPYRLEASEGHCRRWCFFSSQHPWHFRNEIIKKKQAHKAHLFVLNIKKQKHLIQTTNHALVKKVKKQNICQSWSFWTFCPGFFSHKKLLSPWLVHSYAQHGSGDFCQHSLAQPGFFSPRKKKTWVNRIARLQASKQLTKGGIPVGDDKVPWNMFEWTEFYSLCFIGWYLMKFQRSSLALLKPPAVQNIGNMYKFWIYPQKPSMLAIVAT